MTYKKFFFFLFLCSNVLSNEDYRYDAVDYMEFEHEMDNGGILPNSVYFSIHPLAVEGDLRETLKGYNDLAQAEHFKLHNEFLSSEDQNNALVEMLILGIGVSYQQGVLTTWHLSLFGNETVYIDGIEQLSFDGHQAD